LERKIVDLTAEARAKMAKKDKKGELYTSLRRYVVTSSCVSRVPRMLRVERWRERESRGRWIDILPAGRTGFFTAFYDVYDACPIRFSKFPIDNRRANN